MGSGMGPSHVLPFDCMGSGMGPSHPLPFDSIEVNNKPVVVQGPREPLKSGRAKKSGQDKQVSNISRILYFCAIILTILSMSSKKFNQSKNVVGL
jgi:hypothetical protein